MSALALGWANGGTIIEIGKMRRNSGIQTFSLDCVSFNIKHQLGTQVWSTQVWSSQG